jgi:hypothetical protein
MTKYAEPPTNGLLNSDDPQLRNQAVDGLRHQGAGSVPFLDKVMRNGGKDLSSPERLIRLGAIESLRVSGVKNGQ